MPRVTVFVFAATLLVACSSASTETSTSETLEDTSPPATESATGRVVGQPARIETFDAHATDRGSVVFIVSGFVPSNCHEAQLSIEEPDANGAMIASSDAWLDPDCQARPDEQPFMLSLQFPGLPPDSYTAVLDGDRETSFQVEAGDGSGSAVPGVPDDLPGSWRLDSGFQDITGLPKNVEVLLRVDHLRLRQEPLQVELAFGCGDIGGSTSEFAPLLVTDVTIEGIGCDQSLEAQQFPVSSLILVALPTASIENGQLSIQTARGELTFSR